MRDQTSSLFHQLSEKYRKWIRWQVEAKKPGWAWETAPVGVARSVSVNTWFEAQPTGLRLHIMQKVEDERAAYCVQQCRTKGRQIPAKYSDYSARHPAGE